MPSAIPSMSINKVDKVSQVALGTFKSDLINPALKPRAKNPS